MLFQSTKAQYYFERFESTDKAFSNYDILETKRDKVDPLNWGRHKKPCFFGVSPNE